MRGGGSTTCNMPEVAAELEETPANRHDLENMDDHLRRFVAIELKDL